MSRWLLWLPRLVAAVILLPVGYNKLMGGEISSMLFGKLEMEPHGRIIIGLIEVAAALLLLSPQAASGALIAMGVMFGAIIPHLTVLGVEVDGDGGLLMMMLVIVFTSSVAVLIARRGELPIVGSTLGGGNKHGGT